MKKNIIIIVLSVVALLLAATAGYLIADKVISKKYENGSIKDDNENNNGDIKELELNSFLVNSLIYPKSRTGLGMLGYKDSWDYKNETIDTLGRSNMMFNAADDVHYSTDDNNNHIYSAALIKNNFIKIYGPDVNYYDGDIEGSIKACKISKYDSESNVYIAYSGCGGATGGRFKDSVSKKYKAEQDGDYIYVYEYVQSVYYRHENNDDWTSPFVVYLLDRDYKETTILEGADESNYESMIEQMMDRGEVDTYKWTFKKQSDGKYYFYSGAWEN